ncbi:MAG: ABC transporter ATP-binding protein [Clostridiales bacterium]|nr:ABC transporter ATP-binding protein [Clostridiales bacterium]
MKNKETVISVKNLKTFFYSDGRCNPAVNGVSFDVKSGKTLCVVGESGCGKSVTASSIMQLLPNNARIEEGEIVYKTGDSRGDIHIEKLDRNGKEMRSLRGKDIAMIFQDPMTALNPVYTVGWQIEEMIRNHENVTKEEARKRTLKLLADMGIPDHEKRIDQYPHEFSGGMRQRAMIAMAMSCNPKVLIADEPTTALDVTIQAQIFELMEELKEKHNTAILMITHDMGVVSEMADEVAVMYMGNIIESGTAKEVLGSPKHPYTEALLRSIPILGRGKGQDLNPIRGVTPDPFDRPSGCQFEPRCDYATKECSNRMPDEVNLGKTHMVRCIKYQEVSKNE